MNMIKTKATKAMLSLTLATALFFSPSINGSTAHAIVGPISYKIPDPHFEDYSYFQNLADNSQNGNSSLKGKTIILTTNDVHGAIEGYPYIAGLKDTLEKEFSANVLTVDAGDFCNDKTAPIYTTPEKCNAIPLMNAARYDIATLGNHEFKHASYLNKNLEAADFDVVCANVTQKGVFEFDKNHKYTFNEADPDNKITIGFFGLDTPVAKDFDPMITVTTGDKLIKLSKDQVSQLKSEGADIVICLAHLGLEDEFKAKKCRSIDIYNALNPKDNKNPSTSLDLIVDGHSHSTITPPKKSEPEREKILSTGSDFENIGVVVIDNKIKEIEDTFLLKTADLPEKLQNPDVKKMVDKIISETK